MYLPMAMSGKKLGFFSLLLIQWSIFGLLLISLLVYSPTALAGVNPPPTICPQQMVFIPGGALQMGGAVNVRFIEEGPVINATVTPFCIDRYEVTNAQFAQFVKATGYVTVAERPLSAKDFPDLPNEQLLPGSLVFELVKEDTQPVSLSSWWHWTIGANWQHPLGANSTIKGKSDYPVVHIAYEDAVAYAQWRGKSLPTEAQWEYAARGGLVGATYTWGDRYSPKKANTWQGNFPFFNSKADGYEGLAPVGTFPPNGYGLYDMAGNVWELTSDWFSPGHSHKSNQINPTGPTKAESFDPNKPTEKLLHVIKGGSYLCSPNYCSRYRPAARESQTPDTGTSHIGFRLVKNLINHQDKNEV